MKFKYKFTTFCVTNKIVTNNIVTNKIVSFCFVSNMSTKKYYLL